MRNSWICIAAGLLTIPGAGALAVPEEVPVPDAVWTGLLRAGYAGGAGLEAGMIVSDFARGFGVSLRLGVAYVGLDPGDPMAARANFINDATNGTPEESGHVWDLSLDFLVPVKWLDLEHGFLVAGVRHARYTGTFEYVGGNEEFDVTANQWGIGTGLESWFAMGRRTDLVLSAGVDYYFKATLTGHDTSYSPNGEAVNGRDGFDYATADEAINQPKLEGRTWIGVGYRF
jgi:hypothetical protein